MEPPEAFHILLGILICLIHTFAVVLQESRNTTPRTFKTACGVVCVVKGNQAGHKHVYVFLGTNNHI